MALFDLVGRRWALRVLWEVAQADAPITFRALQARCADVSSSVLATRIRELRAAGLLARREGGYALTTLGKSLLLNLRPLQDWAETWAAREAEPPTPAA